MTGESYAGVLVPTTALLLLEARDANFKDAENAPAPYNLKGIALGNACPGNRIFTCTPYSGWIGAQVAVDFRYGHGMISPQTYELLQEACKEDWNKYGPPDNATCREIIGEDPARPVMDEAGDTYQMGGGYFLYDHCGSDLLSVDPQTGMARQNEGRMDGVSLFDDNKGESTTSVYKCGQERAALQWIRLAEVQDAIHVERKPEFSFVTSLNYTFTKYSLLDDYRDTLSQKIRIMQYSGDADPCVPYVGTRRWIDELGLPVKSSWKPWTVSGQVAGYRTVYQGGVNNTFTFTTIRNAGHMVPRHQPRQALHMIKSFLAGEDL
uniref:Carboxypeptidase n=1 Tax=Lotharella oceanica TaxID=641309 RepID=A0A7S2TRU3_9EUKA|mmetsp:Transcript_24442/g.45719  ORF Transcript_24442/g.45719 Transcript_24442/m.45719 type:complete len:322 (+) Transcript_24442:178-1143(+)